MPTKEVTEADVSLNMISVIEIFLPCRSGQVFCGELKSRFSYFQPQRKKKEEGINKFGIRKIKGHCFLILILNLLFSYNSTPHQFFFLRNKKKI